jgi:hypothetical protein
MSEGTKTIEYQRFITTSGGMRDVQQPYILPWPAMEGLMDDANKVDYEQYPPPKELFLLLDEAETPPEIRDIVLRSVNKPEKAATGFQELKAPEDDFADPKMVETSQSSGSSPVMTVVSHSDQSQSRSTSSASLSLHTSGTIQDSDGGTRQGFKKVKLSTFFSSTTNIIGCVKQAMKGPSTAERHDSSEKSKKLGISW